MMTHALPASLRPQLGFLIRLLASPHDGEALGAARAIGRKLGAAGFDFHDLAGLVEGETTTVPGPSPQSAPQPRPKSRRARMWRPPEYVELSAEECMFLAGRLFETLREGHLVRWQKQELRSLFDRLNRGTPLPTRRMIERAEEIITAAGGPAA